MPANVRQSLMPIRHLKLKPVTKKNVSHETDANYKAQSTKETDASLLPEKVDYQNGISSENTDRNSNCHSLDLKDNHECKNGLTNGFVSKIPRPILSTATPSSNRPRSHSVDDSKNTAVKHTGKSLAKVRLQRSVSLDSSSASQKATLKTASKLNGVNLSSTGNKSAFQPVSRKATKNDAADEAFARKEIPHTEYANNVHHQSERKVDVDDLISNYAFREGVDIPESAVSARRHVLNELKRKLKSTRAMKSDVASESKTQITGESENLLSPNSKLLSKSFYNFSKLEHAHGSTKNRKIGSALESKQPGISYDTSPNSGKRNRRKLPTPPQTSINQPLPNKSAPNRSSSEETPSTDRNISRDSTLSPCSCKECETKHAVKPTNPDWDVFDAERFGTKRNTKSQTPSDKNQVDGKHITRRQPKSVQSLNGIYDKSRTTNGARSTTSSTTVTSDWDSSPIEMPQTPKSNSNSGYVDESEVFEENMTNAPKAIPQLVHKSHSKAQTKIPLKCLKVPACPTGGAVFDFGELPFSRGRKQLVLSDHDNDEKQTSPEHAFAEDVNKNDLNQINRQIQNKDYRTNQPVVIVREMPMENSIPIIKCETLPAELESEPKGSTSAHSVKNSFTQTPFDYMSHPIAKTEIYYCPTDMQNMSLNVSFNSSVAGVGSGWEIYKPTSISMHNASFNKYSWCEPDLYNSVSMSFGFDDMCKGDQSYWRECDICYTPQKPTFGSRIKTPPSDRRPVQLYQKTPPNRKLVHIAEAKSSEEGRISGGGTRSSHEGQRARSPLGQGHEGVIRGAGVGSDSEFDAGREQPSGIAQSGSKSSVPSTHQVAAPVQEHLQVSDEEGDRPLTPEDLMVEPEHTEAPPTIGGDSTQSGGGGGGSEALSLSEITSLITSVSSQASSQQITDVLLKKSQSKKLKSSATAPGSGVPAKHATAQEAAKSNAVPGSHADHDNTAVQEKRRGSNASRHSSETPAEPRSNYSRIPADGKSDRKSIPKTTQKTPSPTRKGAGSTHEKRQSVKSRDSGSGASALSGGRLSQSHRVSPHGGPGKADSAKQPASRSRSTDKAKQSNVMNQSKIPTLCRQGSNDSTGQRGTSGDRKATLTPERTQRPRSHSKENKNIPKPQSSQERKSKPLTKPPSHTSGQRQHSQKSTKSTDGPTTPKNLVLRERNDVSFESPVNRDVEADFSSADESAWRSPRPSSVHTRSQQRDLDMSSTFYTSDMERPSAPDGENSRSPTTQAKSVMFSATSDMNKAASKQTPDSKGGRDRLSSTPKGNGAPTDLTLNSHNSISHITYSPRDGRNSTGYNGSTLTSEDGNFDYNDQSIPYTATHQSPSPKRTQTYTEAIKPIDSLRSDYYSQQNRDNLPYKPPTLLTNQRLSETAFANRVLDSDNGGRGVGRDSWKSSTAPAMNGHHFDRLSSGSKTSGSMTSYTVDDVSIRVKSQLKFEEVCCVGLSVHSTLTLQNPTSKWLHVVLKLIALSIDGASVDLSTAMPFVMKEKVIVEPSRTEEVKVIFAPRQAGVYIAQLHVIASPVVSDLPLQADRLPAVVTLQALAEKPQVQLITPSQSRMLDYGAIPFGCHKGLPIAVINQSSASVPVRLVISSNKSSTMWSPHSNCFTFERYTMGDVSSISHKSRPSIPSLSPCVVNYSLPPARSGRELEPTQVMVYFVAPNKHLDRSYTGPPEDFTARIDLEVDSPSSLMKLGSVILRGSAGVARLHAPRDLDCVRLHADVGKVHRQVVPLRNAGNIPIDVSLEVTHFPELFTAIPSQLQVEPGGMCEVAIAFAPKESGNEKLNSLLLMTIEPDGPSYEIQLEGAIDNSDERKRALAHKTSRGPQLLSNKSQLVWGGVPLGRARQQSLTLKNVADQMLKLRLEIKASHDNFQLQSVFGKKDKLSMSKEIIMKPHETFPVHVIFAPSKIRGLEAKLQIRVVNSTLKYTIPLSGYGGISKLIVENAQKGQSNNYWTTLGTPRSQVNSLVTVTVRNVGSRAAYVKCMGFSDLGCKRPIPSARLTMQPEELCIQANTARDLRIIVQPTDKDVLHCNEKPAIVAAIALLYGDELSRQQLRRSIQKYGKSCIKVPENSMVKDVPFHVPFEEEENVAQSEGIKDTPNDVDLFYSTMSRIMVALVGEPEPLESLAKPQLSITETHTFAQSNTGHLSNALSTQNSNLDPKKTLTSSLERSTTPINHGVNTGDAKSDFSPPVRDSTASRKLYTGSGGFEGMKTPTGAVTVDFNPMTSAASSGVGSGRMGRDWSVQPEQIVLPAPSSGFDPVIKRLQLNNHRDRSLSYDMSWPAHVINVTPEQGKVAPHGSAIISVSPQLMLRSKQIQLPWSGHLHLTCNKKHQVVNVQIREGAMSEDSILLPENAQPLAAVPGTPMTCTSSAFVSVATPVHPGVKSLTHSKTPIQQLAFDTTMVDKTTDAFMEVTNTSAFPIKWHLSSFTPPYFKASGNEHVLRVTYSVYWLPRHAGLVQPGEKEQIKVCFQPREVGAYSQHWELKTEAQGVPLQAAQRTKYEFLAEAIHNTTNPPGIAWTEVIAENLLKSTTSSNVRNQEEAGKVPAVELREERLVFPLTSKGESHICKMQLKNKTNSLHSVTFHKPEAPFSMSHSKITLKPRHFVRVPVEFRPKKSGHYQGVVICKVDTGLTLSVPVIGQCK